jgi:hypothetical protein
VTGIVVAEWEERSPWSPLSVRRGIERNTNAVTVHGCTGTIDVADITADNGRDLVEVIGKSLAVMGTNAFIGSHHGAELMLALAPPWADLIAASYPHIDDVCAELWRHAALPVDWWPKPHRDALYENQRVDGDGIVHVVDSPTQLLVMVCGGLGNLHSLALHSFGPTQAVTRAF